MEPLLDGADFQIAMESLQEVSGLTDRLIQIKRNSGFTGGTLDGVAASPNYKYFDVMATVEEVTQQEIVHSGGMLSLGNLRIAFNMNVLEKGEGGDGYVLQEGDVVIYDQKEWHSVGIPFRNYVAGGVTHVSTYWRRT